MSNFTHTLQGLDSASRTVIAREVVDAAARAERAAADRARRIAARDLRCDPDDMDRHIAGFAEDGAPEFGACTETCHIFPTTV